MLLLMAVGSDENISEIKICRMTEYSRQLLRNILKFMNVQFKIKECDDNVFDDSSSDEEESGEEKPNIELPANPT
jgi:hypothetical protein